MMVWRIALFILVFGWLGSGCSRQGSPALTPEQAAVDSLVSEPASSGIRPSPATIRVVQSAQLDDQVFVFMSYQGLDEKNMFFQCETVRGAIREGSGWRVSGGGSGCISGAAPDEPLTWANGTHGQPGVDMVSYAYGFVKDPEITTVTLTWEDQTEQPVEVANGSYLAVRSGEFQLLKVAGLDTEGAALASFEIIVAPGK